MSTLLAALEKIGMRPPVLIPRDIHNCPRSIRELSRILNLPQPRLNKLELDDSHKVWSFEEEEPQGIAYGGGSCWFLSSRSSVFRCNIGGPDIYRPSVHLIEKQASRDDLISRIGLNTNDYDHIGAICYRDGLLFLPLRTTNQQPAYLVLAVNRDLDPVGWAKMMPTSGDTLCAVNPWSGYLYTLRKKSFPTEGDELEAYDVEAFYHVLKAPERWGSYVDIQPRENALIRLLAPDRTPDSQGPQGAHFSKNGRIYVVRSGSWSYSGFENRLLVYNALTGVRFCDPQTYDFNGIGDELEDVCVHPETGVLYLAVAEIDKIGLPGKDSFDLYTGRFQDFLPEEV